MECKVHKINDFVSVLSENPRYFIKYQHSQCWNRIITYDYIGCNAAVQYIMRQLIPPSIQPKSFPINRGDNSLSTAPAYTELTQLIDNLHNALLPQTSMRRILPFHVFVTKKPAEKVLVTIILAGGKLSELHEVYRLWYIVSIKYTLSISFFPKFTTIGNKSYADSYLSLWIH